MSDRPLFIRLSLPVGLEEALENVAREVLRSHPKNIYQFAAEHFEDLLRKRNEERGLPRDHDLFFEAQGSEEEAPLKESTPDDDVTDLESLSGERNEFDGDADAEAAATKIQAGFRGCKARKEVKRIKEVEGQRRAIQIKMPAQEEDYDDIDNEPEEETAEHEVEVKEKEEEAPAENGDVGAEYADDAEAEAAATKIQAGYRGMKTRKDMKARVPQPEVTAPTDEEEMTNEEDEIDLNDPEANEAAAKIQAGYRGMRVRKEMKSQKQTASGTEVESESQLPDLDDEEAALAATKIQAGYRGMKTRKDMKKRKEEESEQQNQQEAEAEAELVPEVENEGATAEDDEGEMEMAATKIQAGYRGMKTRKEMKEKRKEAEAEPETGDNVNEIALDEEAEVAATKIQAGYRGMKTRKEMKERRAASATPDAPLDKEETEKEEVEADEIPSGEEAEHAATKIQAGYRGMKTRKELRQRAHSADEGGEPELDLTDEAEAAATKIQAGYRGMAARKEYQQTKAVLEERKRVPKSLDEFNRMIEDEIVDIDLSDPDVEKAATTIQAGYRGMRARGEMRSKNQTEPEETPEKNQTDAEEEDKGADVAAEEEVFGEDEAAAATKIQAGYRGMKTRKELKGTKATGQEEPNKDQVNEDNGDIPVESAEVAEEDKVDIDLNDPDVEKAATTIQAGYRGMHARKQQKAKKEGVGTPLNDEAVVEPEKEEEALGEFDNDAEAELAATKIQAGYRGMKTRKDMKAKRAEADPVVAAPDPETLVEENADEEAVVDLDDAECAEAATKIQAGFKGMKARKEVKKMKQEASEKAEAAALASKRVESDFSIDLDDPELEAAATKVQAGFKGLKVRKELSMKKKSTDLEDETAAVAKVEDPAAALEDIANDPEAELAATKIQAGYKGMRARKEVKAMKESKHSKYDEEMVNDLEMDKAASKIQAGFRGMKARKEVKALRQDRLAENMEQINEDEEEDEEPKDVGAYILLEEEDDDKDNGDEDGVEICDVRKPNEEEEVAEETQDLGAIPFEQHPSAARDGKEEEEDAIEKEKEAEGAERTEEGIVLSSYTGDKAHDALVRQMSILDSPKDDPKPSPSPPVQPSITIYHYRGSYCSQKVLMYLYERGIDFTGFHVDLQRNEHLSKWFLELNPKGEVPVMKMDSRVVTDSTRIIHTLETSVSSEAFPPQLVPASSDTKLYQLHVYFSALFDQIPVSQVSHGLAFHPEVCSLSRDTDSLSRIRQMVEQRGVVLRQAAEEAPPDAADELRRKAAVHENDVLPTLTDRAAYDDLLARVDAALDKAEQHLAEEGAGVWLLGKDISAVDIALGVILNQLALLGLAQRMWAKRPRLTRLLMAIQKRASFAKAVLEVGDPGPAPALDSADDAGNDVGGISLAMELSDRPMASAESLEVWHELQSGARADQEEVVDGEAAEEEDETRTWRSLW